MALRDAIAWAEAQPLIQLIKEEPEAKDKIVEKYSDIVSHKVARGIRTLYATIFIKLYSYDCEALKRDITKYAVLKPIKIPTKKERTDLLLCLMSNLPTYFQNDYSIILNECQRIIETHKVLQEDGQDVPFV